MQGSALGFANGNSRLPPPPTTTMHQDSHDTGDGRFYSPDTPAFPMDLQPTQAPPPYVVPIPPSPPPEDLHSSGDSFYYTAPGEDLHGDSYYTLDSSYFEQDDGYSSSVKSTTETYSSGLNCLPVAAVIAIVAICLTISCARGRAAAQGIGDDTPSKKTRHVPYGHDTVVAHAYAVDASTPIATAVVISDQETACSSSSAAECDCEDDTPSKETRHVPYGHDTVVAHAYAVDASAPIATAVVISDQETDCSSSSAAEYDCEGGGKGAF